MKTVQGQEVSAGNHEAKAAPSARSRSAVPAEGAGQSAFSRLFTASQRRVRERQLDDLACDAAAVGRASSAHAKPRWEEEPAAANPPAAQTEPPLRADSAPDGPRCEVAATPAFSPPVSAASEESADWLALASLLPAGEDDGLFEVTLPNSEKIGVSVSDLPAGLSYLLIPEDDQLAARLRGHKMELEGYLKRRIRRNVKVAVI